LEMVRCFFAVLLHITQFGPSSPERKCRLVDRYVHSVQEYTSFVTFPSLSVIVKPTVMIRGMAI